MKHLGDITKINGAEMVPVNVIIGGSPCQDLSVAGGQKGFNGDRSVLFMDQIRIIKEMRAKYGKPRFMVWENVPGAFSSNKGADFGAVLTETVRIAEPKAPIVPMPKNGWPTAGCLTGDGVGGKWSVAWRVFDAQFWGVPQRRRRIALIADFGGESASEILFERESLQGNIEQSRPTRQTAPPPVAESAAVSINNRGAFYNDKTETLRSESHGALPVTYCIQGNCIDRADTAGCNGKGWTEGVSYTLNTMDRPAVCGAFKYRQGAKAGNIGYQDNTSPTLNANQLDAAVFLALENHPQDSRMKIAENNVVQTLNGQMGTGGNNTPMILKIAQGVDGYNAALTGDKSSMLGVNCGMSTGRNGVITLDRAAFNQGINAKFNIGIDENGLAYTVVAKGPGAVCIGNGQTDQLKMSDVCGTLDCMHDQKAVLIQPYGLVRRLTPLECERLQGYPLVREVKFTEMTKDEYIAWNIAERNILVDTENGYVYATRGPGGRKVEPFQLKGTLVNGYRTVSIRNGETKIQCRVHRIVWIAAYGVIPDGYVVDHINNDKSDNRLCNLQLLTPAENSTKAAEDGLYKSGTDNKATKIDPAKHDLIQYLYGTGGYTIRQLAESFGISKSRIHQIIRDRGWTQIGDIIGCVIHTDDCGNEYKEYIYEYTDEQGKKKKVTDSARYKALGNSISLPNWFYVLQRLSLCCGADSTMASLFDGIGGFPLIWETLNGKGSCIWASEIEDFPIAVTKTRFPETEVIINE